MYIYIFICNLIDFTLSTRIKSSLKYVDNSCKNACHMVANGKECKR